MLINSQTQIFTGKRMEGSQKKVKLIFVFNVDGRKCFIYSLRPPCILSLSIFLSILVPSIISLVTLILLFEL